MTAIEELKLNVARVSDAALKAKERWLVEKEQYVRALADRDSVIRDLQAQVADPQWLAELNQALAVTAELLERF